MLNLVLGMVPRIYHCRPLPSISIYVHIYIYISKSRRPHYTCIHGIHVRSCRYHLAGGFNLSEKYESVGTIISNILEITFMFQSTSQSLKTDESIQCFPMHFQRHQTQTAHLLDSAVGVEDNLYLFFSNILVTILTNIGLLFKNQQNGTVKSDFQDGQLTLPSEAMLRTWLPGW